MSAREWIVWPALSGAGACVALVWSLTSARHARWPTAVLLGLKIQYGVGLLLALAAWGLAADRRDGAYFQAWRAATVLAAIAVAARWPKLSASIRSRGSVLGLSLVVVLPTVLFAWAPLKSSLFLGPRGLRTETLIDVIRFLEGPRRMEAFTAPDRLFSFDNPLVDPGGRASANELYARGKSAGPTLARVLRSLDPVKESTWAYAMLEAAAGGVNASTETWDALEALAAVGQSSQGAREALGILAGRAMTLERDALASSGLVRPCVGVASVRLHCLDGRPPSAAVLSAAETWLAVVAKDGATRYLVAPGEATTALVYAMDARPAWAFMTAPAPADLHQVTLVLESAKDMATRWRVTNLRILVDLRSDSKPEWLSSPEDALPTRVSHWNAVTPARVEVDIVDVQTGKSLYQTSLVSRR